MTQRIFRADNEQDMKDLWDILDERVEAISPSKMSGFIRLKIKNQSQYMLSPIGVVFCR